MKKESLLKVFFFHCILAMIICPFYVNAATNGNIFGSGLNRTTKTIIDSSTGNVTEQTCSNSYVEIMGVHGYKSCLYDFYSFATPRSFTWWFNDFSYTKGKNWQVDFRIYGSALEFEFSKTVPNITVDTDYGTITCKVSYGGNNYLNVSCAGQSTKMFVITIWPRVFPNITGHYFVLSNDYSTITTDLDSSSIINNQNQNQQQTNERLEETNKQISETNKQLEETNKQMGEVNKNLGATNDYLKDDTPPEADISGLGNVQGLLPAGPVDSLLNIPFYFLSIVTSSFGGVCKPLTGTFVFDQPFSLPCFSEIIYDEVPDNMMIFINLIPTTFMLIIYFKHLYKKVSRAVSLETTGDDEWGVL